MLYASAISDGVHNLMTMESAPAEVRARRIVAKLTGVPALLEAARANLTNPPRVMAERGVRMLKGASAMLREDLALAFAGLQGRSVEDRTWSTAGDAAARAIDAFVAVVRERAAAEGRRSLHGRHGQPRGALQGRGADRPAGRVAPGHRRARAGAKEAAFAAAAARVDKAQAGAGGVGGRLEGSPGRGEVVPAAQKAVDELQAFVVGKRLVEPAAVGDGASSPPAREFDLGLASMHASPPLEADAGEELLLHHRRAGDRGRRRSRTPGCRSSTTRRWP